MKKTFAFAAAAALLALVPSHAGNNQATPSLLPAPPSDSTCPNYFTHEPLVAYDVTGSVLAGTISRNLVVFTDGTAKFSSYASFTGEERTEQAFLNPAVTRQLWRDLRDAGAFEICDRLLIVNDVPLNTLTMFRGNTEATAHTFSWIAALDEIAEVHTILATFIDEHFPAPVR